MLPVEASERVGTVVVPVIVIPALLIKVNDPTLRFPPIDTVPPVPALTLSVIPVPVTLSENETLAPLIVLMAVAAPTVTGPVSVTADPAVVILPYRLMIPV